MAESLGGWHPCAEKEVKNSDEMPQSARLSVCVWGGGGGGGGGAKAIWASVSDNSSWAPLTYLCTIKTSKSNPEAFKIPMRVS